MLLDTLILKLQLLTLPAVNIFLARARMILRRQYGLRMDSNLVHLRTRLCLLEVELGRVPAFMSRRCATAFLIIGILLHEGHIDRHCICVDILYVVDGALLLTCSRRKRNVRIELATDHEVRSADSLFHALSLRVDLVVVERSDLATELERLAFRLQLSLV